MGAVADRKRVKHGKWVRLAAKRFLDDLKRAVRPRAPFTFDPDWANRACTLIELLPHVEGVWPKGTTIVLEPAQVFFIVNLFGFRSPTGARRFTSALFAVSRKNAKSTLAAGVLLVCYCLEPEMGPQVISAATTGDQARIVFNIAKRMVTKTSELREAFSLEAFANAIARFDVGGTFKPINAKASTQDGLNPSAVCLDELHAHKTSDLLDVLQSAEGARTHKLYLYTTTEGYENPGPWHEIRHFAKQVLDGVVQADHFLALYYALDDEDDDFDASKWIKANPLLGVSCSLDALKKAAVEAKAMPGRLAEFRIKRLNRPAAAANGWIDLPRWKRCDGEVDLDALAGHPCWGGMDLASTRDLAAFRLLWLVDGIYYTWGRRWVPTWAVTQRTNRGTVPYGAWVSGGLVVQTDGDVTDYAVIERDILTLCEQHAPQAIAFDPWNATDLVNRLLAKGLPMLQFRQGTRSFHPAMQELERAYTGRNLRHGGDPVLSWCASNLVARLDENLNSAPDRKRSADKIDDMVALLMAFGVSQSATQTAGPARTIEQGFVAL